MNTSSYFIEGVIHQCIEIQATHAIFECVIVKRMLESEKKQPVAIVIEIHVPLKQIKYSKPHENYINIHLGVNNK